MSKLSRRRLLSTTCFTSIQLVAFRTLRADILLLSPGLTEVAEWAISQLLRGAGATLFKQMFSDGRQLNWSQLIQKSVRETETLVRKELTENEIRKLTAQLEHVERLMALYNTNKSLELLNYATRDISQALSQLKSFDIVAYGGFILASFEYIAILQERATRFSWTEGNTLNQGIDEVETHLKSLHAQWDKWIDDKFSDIETKTIPGYFQDKHEVWYTFTDQGNQQIIKLTSDWIDKSSCENCWAQGMSKLSKQRQEHIIKEKQRIHRQYLALGENLLRKLDELRS